MSSDFSQRVDAGIAYVPALNVSQRFRGNAGLARDLVQASLVGPKRGQGNVKNISHLPSLSDMSPVVKRHIAFNLRHTIPMTSRTILGSNLTALMKTGAAQQKQLNSNKKVGDRLKISDNTVGRIRRGQNSIGIDMLDKIAALYCLHPWQLLVVGFDPANPPMLRAMNDHERALYERLHAALQAIEKQ